MMRLARYAALVLATLTILVLLWQFNVAVVMFLLSLAVAASFRPLIETLIQRGFRKEFALAISFGSVLLVLITLFLLASGPLVTDLQQATNDFQQAYEQVKNRWSNDQNPLLSNLAGQFPPTQSLYNALTGDGPSLVIQALFGAAEGTFQFMARLVIVLVLSLYWSTDHVHFERLWLSLLPVEGRAQARKIWQDIESGVGAHLRREITLSVLSGVLFWLGYFALGVKYATLLALMGAFARMIPWLGPVLAVALPLMAGSRLGWWAGMVAAIYAALILILLERTLGARIVSRLRSSSLLWVIVAIAMIDSFGLPGAVLAPVLAVALQILFTDLLPVYVMNTNGASADSLANLQVKLELMKHKAADLKGPDSTESDNLVTRLEQIMEKRRSNGHKYQDMN